MFPFDEDFCIYDFEVDAEDEKLCAFSYPSFLAGKKADNGAMKSLPF
jgi:hypothetical protein